MTGGPRTPADRIACAEDRLATNTFTSAAARAEAQGSRLPARSAALRASPTVVSLGMAALRRVRAAGGDADGGHHAGQAPKRCDPRRIFGDCPAPTRNRSFKTSG